MKQDSEIGCEGCSFSEREYLCYRMLNNDKSCPCTICLMKIMMCEITSSMNDSCDRWMKWFSAKYLKHRGYSIDAWDRKERDRVKK